jgi:hypothetical protein
MDRTDPILLIKTRALLFIRKRCTNLSVLQYPIKNRCHSDWLLYSDHWAFLKVCRHSDLKPQQKCIDTTTSMYYHIWLFSSSDKLSDRLFTARPTHLKTSQAPHSAPIPTICSQCSSRLVSGAAEEFTVQPRWSLLVRFPSPQCISKMHPP